MFLNLQEEEDSFDNFLELKTTTNYEYSKKQEKKKERREYQSSSNKIVR